MASQTPRSQRQASMEDSNGRSDPRHPHDSIDSSTDPPKPSPGPVHQLQLYTEFSHATNGNQNSSGAGPTAPVDDIMTRLERASKQPVDRALVASPRYAAPSNPPCPPKKVITQSLKSVQFGNVSHIPESIRKPDTPNTETRSSNTHSPALPNPVIGTSGTRHPNIEMPRHQNRSPTRSQETTPTASIPRSSSGFRPAHVIFDRLPVDLSNGPTISESLRRTASSSNLYEQRFQAPTSPPQPNNNVYLAWPTRPAFTCEETDVYDVVYDPSQSSKDMTVRLEIPIEDDLSADLESLCRFRRLGQFSEARELYHSRLERDDVTPYVFVHYAEILLASGDYKSFQKLIYPDDDFEDDRGATVNEKLKTNFQLMRLLSCARVQNHTIVALQTVRETLKELRSGNVMGSTEIQMFALCLQVLKHLDASSHWQIVEQVAQTAKTLFNWKRLYYRLLDEDRIWDFRDLFVNTLSLFGWDQTAKLLFDSHPLHQVLEAIRDDWLQSHDDEANVLGLLDIFTSLILSTHMSDQYDGYFSSSSMVQHARAVAGIVQKNMPDNMNTRPFVQWILAKAVTELRPSPRRSDGTTLKDFKGLLLERESGIHLPVFVPMNHFEKPDWGMVSSRPNPALRNAVEVALGAAMETEDYHMQSLALRIICLQSQNPGRLFDALEKLQLEIQGDTDGFLATCTSRYLLSRTPAEERSLLMSFRQLSRVLGNSHLQSGTDPSLLWASDVISGYLAEKTSGEKVETPCWTENVGIYGSRLPEYIATFIQEHFHLTLPPPIGAFGVQNGAFGTQMQDNPLLSTMDSDNYHAPESKPSPKVIPCSPPTRNYFVYSDSEDSSMSFTTSDDESFYSPSYDDIDDPPVDRFNDSGSSGDEHDAKFDANSHDGSYGFSPELLRSHNITVIFQDKSDPRESTTRQIRQPGPHYVASRQDDKSTKASKSPTKSTTTQAGADANKKGNIDRTTFRDYYNLDASKPTKSPTTQSGANTNKNGNRSQNNDSEQHHPFGRHNSELRSRPMPMHQAWSEKQDGRRSESQNERQSDRPGEWSSGRRIRKSGETSSVVSDSVTSEARQHLARSHSRILNRSTTSGIDNRRKREPVLPEQSSRASQPEEGGTDNQSKASQTPIPLSAQTLNELNGNPGRTGFRELKTGPRYDYGNGTTDSECTYSTSDATFSEHAGPSLSDERVPANFASLGGKKAQKAPETTGIPIEQHERKQSYEKLIPPDSSFAATAAAAEEKTQALKGSSAPDDWEVRSLTSAEMDDNEGFKAKIIQRQTGDTIADTIYTVEKKEED